MKLSEVQREFTRDIAKLIVYAYQQGIELTFGDAYRPLTMQYLYYYGYKILDKSGVLELVKAKRRSKTLNSKHQKRCAVDFNFFINNKLTYKKEDVELLGTYWESLNEKNKWGGNFTSFTDTPHFERRT